MELVDDVHEPHTVAVGMPHRVGARLGQRELQVAEHLRRQRLGSQPRNPRQREPPEGDVLGLGGNRQANCLSVAVTVLGRVEFAVFATAYFLAQVPLLVSALVLFRLCRLARPVAPQEASVS